MVVMKLASTTTRCGIAERITRFKGHALGGLPVSNCCGWEFAVIKTVTVRSFLARAYGVPPPRDLRDFRFRV